jgi:hypothetical protein
LGRKYSIVLQEWCSKRYGKKYYEKFFNSIARHLNSAIFPSDHEEYYKINKTRFSKYL